MSVVDYSSAYQVLLESYPEYCRVKIRKNNKFGISWVSGELEIGYALDQMRGVLESPIENLMLYTAGLILIAGRESGFTHDVFVGKLRNIISEHGLEFLLGQVSLADSKSIKSDLEILGIV